MTTLQPAVDEGLHGYRDGVRPPSSRSRDLIDAAAEVLDREGPHALSLRRLATDVGTSTQSVYTEFGGKSGLADALFRLGYQRLLDELDRCEPPADPIDRISALARIYRAVALRHPAHYELMTGRPLAEYRPTPESLMLAASSMQPLVDAVIDAVDARALSGDPALIARDLWAGGHGYVSLEIAGLVASSDDDFDRYLADRLASWRT